MRITKYHGLGNDFIITTEHEVEGRNLSEFAKAVCNRHSGIGADGLIIVKEKNLEMVYYNSDGSRAKMCGNGIRCFSKFIYDEGINKENEFTVYTLAGHMNISVKSRTPYRCEVNMGKPDFAPKNIPVETIKSTFRNESITVLDKDFVVSSLLLGATHTVIEVDDLDSFNIELYGKEITTLSIFPDSTNANFFEYVSKEEIKMQTFERGAGLTLACGTGASAVVANLFEEGRVSNQVKVQLPLGHLFIRRDQFGNILMEGPAEKILDGEFGD